MKRFLCALALAAALVPPARASEELMRTVGAAGGSNLYLAHISIGVIADAFQSKLYDADKTIGLVNSLIGQSKVVKDYYQDLLDKNVLPSHDVSYIRELVLVYASLISEGEVLLKYVRSGSGASPAEFNRQRIEAGSRIDKLLNIK